MQATIRNISIKSIESKNFYQSSAHLTQSSKVQILRGPLNHALASGRYVPCHFKKNLRVLFLNLFAFLIFFVFTIDMA